MNQSPAKFERVDLSSVVSRSLPDFIVIGAMKSATTTLHAQLACQEGLFMSRLKEPNFFSDDENYARGLEWYASLFASAGEYRLRGESSTHYTKLPTHPHTVSRMIRVLPHVKLIYVMRHPIDRLTSHYLHELTVGRIRSNLEEAIEQHRELVDYSRYSMQLEPYLRAYGSGSILPVFFDRLVGQPDREIERIGQFLGAARPLRWNHAIEPQNVGRDRLRNSPLRNALVQAPVLTTLRRALLPIRLSEHMKTLWKVKMDPPQVSSSLRAKLSDLFDRDLARLGAWLGITLDCDCFHKVAGSQPCSWAQFDSGSASKVGH